MHPSKQPSLPKISLKLWGHLSGAFGLGEGARCTVRALEAAGVQVHAQDIPLATHVNDQPVAGEQPGGMATIDLIHTNPNILNQTDGLRERLNLQAPLRIGYWAWELDTFPRGWDSGFKGLDQLWCPSNFCASSLGQRSPIPVSAIPHLIDWERADTLFHQRKLLENKPNGVFTCLFAFDLWSTTARKNPEAVIDAFTEAFPRRSMAGTGQPEARLILKVGSAEQFPELHEQLQLRVTSDPRIKLISKHLSRAALDRLYLEADVLVHLHRSEGFGLCMAEAMASGLPVVATAYSGNLDFMPLESAVLVPFTLTKNPRQAGDYPAGCTWAEPDVNYAAAALRHLAGDAGARERLAKRGRQAARTWLGRKRITSLVTQRLGCLLARAGRAELLAALPAGHPLRLLEG